MSLPPHLQRDFEPFLTRPMVSTRALRKQVDAAVAQLGDAPTAAAVGHAVQGLLAAVNRKTTPLYLRLIHGAAHLFLRRDRPAGDYALDVAVIDMVTATIRRPELAVSREDRGEV